MGWHVDFDKRAVKQLQKMDRTKSKIILAWLRKNIEGCDDPRSHGKSLVGDMSEKWRYRVGDYRILCEIKDDELLVLAIKVGHRRDVYRS